MEILIAGASLKQERYSNMAFEMLQEYDFNHLHLVGNREGNLGAYGIKKHYPEKAVDTITVYLSAKNQGDLKAYVSSYLPKRIIFNPGAENKVWESELAEAGVQVLNACTLVMLRTKQF